MKKLFSLLLLALFLTSSAPNPDLETLCNNRAEGWSLYIDNNTGVIYHQYRQGNVYITDEYPVDHPQHNSIFNTVCNGN